MGWLQRWFGERQQPHISAMPHTVTLPGVGQLVITRTLDCIGSSCPRPQLLTMRVLDELQEGEVFELLSDNAATVETLPALMFSQGGTHVATRKLKDHWRVYMRKGVFVGATNVKGES